MEARTKRASLSTMAGSSRLLQHIEAVFQRRDALVLVLEDDQIFRRNARIDHLPVLVVGHGRDAVGLLLQQRIDVEALLQNGHAVIAAFGRNAELAHPRQERILVAEEPDAQRLARKSSGEVMPVSLRQVSIMPDFLNGWAMLTSGTPFSRGQSRRHPVDDHVGAAAGDHLRRRDVRTARLDRDVEVFLFVEALVLAPRSSLRTGPA
jgi:hypothetical protein